jgi:hypothetical protein
MAHVSLSGLLTFDESIFFHKATRTLIVADLLVNACAVEGSPKCTRFGYRLLGLNGDLKIFPILRWFGFANNASLRRAAQRIFEWNPERLIVGHGKPIKDNAYRQLRGAFRWLTA